MRALRRVAVAATVVMASLVGGIHTESVSAERAPAHVTAPCPDPAGPVLPATVAEAEQLLIGTWIVCSGQVLPPLSPTEVGIQFDADGRFFRVYEGDDGKLTKVEGLDQQGEWEFIDNEFNTQLDLRLLGRGTFIQIVEFFSTPPLLQATTMAEGASLVPWIGDPPEPGVPAGIGEGPCGLPQDPVALTSVDQVAELLSGTWLTCNASSPFGPLAFGEVGITITPDGGFSRVYQDSEGALINASGPGEEGTWQVVGQSGPGSYQVDLTLDGGTIIAHPVFLQQPPHMRLVSGGNDPVDYQRSATTPMPGVPPTPEPAAPPDALPETGSNILLTLLALGLVGGGFLLVGMSRRGAARHG